MDKYHLRVAALATAVACAAAFASATSGHPVAAGAGLLAAMFFLASLQVYVAQVHASERARAARESERDTVFVPTLEALSAAIESRDPRAAGHNHRVRAYAVGLASAMRIRDEGLLASLRYGAILHDVGRIAIPDRLLHAATLSDEDLTLVRRHVIIGTDLVRHVPFPAGVIAVVHHHHERWDGHGYPDGLAGDAIPLPARIVALCDVFDTLCTGANQPAMDSERALQQLEAEAGTAFDPALVAEFAKWRRAVDVAFEPEPSSLSSASEEIRTVAREQARLSDLAFRDELTGLRNGRALHRELQELCAQGTPFVLMLCDLDAFKQINDRHGHEAGDRALAVVGQALLALGRPAWRNGGDEFVVAAPGSIEAALEADRVREAIEGCSLRVRGGSFALRASVGAVVHAGGEAAHALRAADDAMYAVKARRRVASTPAPAA